MMTRAFLIVALLVSTAASAEVYRWVDGKGNVHYSDRPAENAQVVGVASRPTNREVLAQRTAEEREERSQVATADTQRQKDQQTADSVKQDLSRTREEQCKKAQEAYKTAIESQRLYREGKDGERQYLTDAELTETRLNSRKAVDELCKPIG